MSYPLYLVAEQDQLQIVHGYDIPPVKSDRGMFMRTVPMKTEAEARRHIPDIYRRNMQQTVVVDDQMSHRLLDVSNRVSVSNHVSVSEPVRVSKRTVGREPRLKERIGCGIRSEAKDNHAFSSGRLNGVQRKMYVLPDPEHAYSEPSPISASSSIMVDSANKFYLFSISVIGLYMFYRVLQLSAESRK